MDTNGMDTDETARGVVYVPWDDGYRLVLVAKRELHNFPGGRIKVGETPEEAFLRELKEETGLAVQGRPIYCGSEKYNGHRRHIFGAFAQDNSTLKHRGTHGEKVLVATEELFRKLVDAGKFITGNERIFDTVKKEAERRAEAKQRAA